MIIFRYLFKEIYFSLLAITLVLLVILLTNELAHYLNLFGKGYFTMLDVMKIMSTQIPLLLGYLIPLGFYLAILFGFGRLYMNYEMVVLFSCGLSQIKLFGMVMAIASLVCFIVAGLLLWVEPAMEKIQFKIINQAIAHASVEKIMPKQFNLITWNSVFYAEHRSIKHQKLRNVFLAIYNDDRNIKNKLDWDVAFAKEASERRLPNNPANNFLIFNDGYRYVGQPGDKKYEIMKYKTYGISLPSPVPHNNGWPLSATTASLFKLGTKNAAASAVLQWRMSMPISVIILALIAFSFSKMDPRSGKFKKIFPAILLFSIYFDLIYMCRHWIKKGVLNPHIGIWWLHGIMLLLAIFLLMYQFYGNRIRYLLHMKKLS